jgi:hypothetical protein
MPEREEKIGVSRFNIYKREKNIVTRSTRVLSSTAATASTTLVLLIGFEGCRYREHYTRGLVQINAFLEGK